MRVTLINDHPRAPFSLGHPHSWPSHMHEVVIETPWAPPTRQQRLLLLRTPPPSWRSGAAPGRPPPASRQRSRNLRGPGGKPIPGFSEALACAASLAVIARCAEPISSRGAPFQVAPPHNAPRQLPPGEQLSGWSSLPKCLDWLESSPPLPSPRQGPFVFMSFSKSPKRKGASRSNPPRRAWFKQIRKCGER